MTNKISYMMKSLFKKIKLLISFNQKHLLIKITLMFKVNQIQINQTKVNSFFKQKNKYKN